MDKLEEIFRLQGLLQDRLKEERGLNFSMEEWLQRQTLAMVSELAELLEEVNFKWWKNPHELNSEHIHEELCDILHFFIAMCIESGMDAEKLYQVYTAKNHENHLRQDGLSAKPGYKAPTNPEKDE